MREIRIVTLAGPVLKSIGDRTRAGFERMNQALKERAESASPERK